MEANARSYISSVEVFTNYTSINEGTLLTAPKIATAYNVPTGTGAGVKIGIISLGGGFSQSDLDQSMADLGLTAPTVTFVGVDGATNDYTADPNSADGENALDLVCVAGMVPQANIVLYKGQNRLFYDGFLPRAVDYNKNSSFGNTIQRAIDENCDVITISWGVSEVRYSNGVPIYCGAFMENQFANAAAKSISVFVASGDYGSTADSGVNIVNVDYPSLSANVIAVGGTYLTLDGSNQRATETVYYRSQPGYLTGFAGSGGVSIHMPLPAWQANLTYRRWFRSNSSMGPVTSLTTRGVPDISAAMNAYGVRINGVIGGHSGTSAAAPIAAGIFARYISIHGRRPPKNSIHSILYSNLDAYYDIFSGNNASQLSTGYAASTDWDPVTGLGVPFGNTVQQLVASAGTTIKTADNTWKSVANVRVKTDATTWSNVRAIWTKTISGWRQTY
jgi:subtilase family serine protease